MLNELPLKNLLILFKALIDEHGVTLGMPFLKHTSNGRFANCRKLQRYLT